MKCHLSSKFLNRSGHGLMIASRLDQVYCLVKERFGKFVKNLFLLGYSRPQRVCGGGGGGGGVQRSKRGMALDPQDNFRKKIVYLEQFLQHPTIHLGENLLGFSKFQPV